MKLIELWLVMTVWLAMHQSVNDHAALENHTALENQAVQKDEAAVKRTEPERTEAGAGSAGIGTEKPEAETAEAGAETEGAEAGSTEAEAETAEPEAGPTETGAETAKPEAGTTEAQSGTELETETETESEIESETERGEEQKKVFVTELYAAYEKETKLYDGMTYVRLEAVTEGLPEGSELLVWGETEKPDAGQWEVTPFFSLTGESAEDYEICLEAAVPMVTVAPRPLRIEISDAKKYYFAENALSALRPLKEDAEMVEVSGFVEEEAPEGFCLPELAIDENVLKKGSPMYENGLEKEYKGAIVVKTRADGTPTGNPTGNYCFVLDTESGYYKTGSVFLEPPPVVGTLDYRLTSRAPGAMYRDEEGILWVKRGTVIVIEPQKRSGFTECAETSALYESGSAGFVLQKRAKGGEITAKSQMQQFSFCVDGEGPEGALWSEGGEVQQGVRYSRENVTVRITGAKDEKSGLCSVKLYAGRDAARSKDPAQLYRDTAPYWTEGREITLTEEGSFRVFARLEDRVGNTAYCMSEQICIDRTPPELVIMGLSNQSANNGAVAPAVSCADLHYEEGSLEVVLEGSRVGKKRFAQEREALPTGERVSVGDIPREKRWDDLYVLCAQARDKAGNDVQKKLVFSVNRFGSVFQTEEKVQKKLARYYLQNPVDLIIREFNVDTLSRAAIYMGDSEQVRELEEGREYFVIYKGRKQGWQQYQYRIPAENFRREGSYYVVIVTKDRAGNTADNRIQKQKLEFVVDRTPPSILVTGVENGGIYKEKRTVEIECRDDVLLDSAEVYLNDGLAVQNRQENQKLTLTPSARWQKLMVRAADGAGNIGTSPEIWVYLGEPSQAQEAVPEQVKRRLSPVSQEEGTAREAERKTKETAGSATGTEEEEACGKGQDAPETEGTPEENAEAKRAATLLGMGFLSLLGVYFYKNKRVKE